ncbi:MAG: hypothetical protein ACYCW6_09605, partial [Candidatus Xenobia bacterium]
MRTRLLPDGTKIAIMGSHRNQELGVVLLLATVCFALPALLILYVNQESGGPWLALLPVALLLEAGVTRLPKRVLVMGRRVEIQDGRTIGAELNGVT